MKIGPAPELPCGHPVSERQHGHAARVCEYALERSLRVVCAWCGRHLRGPHDASLEETSHGICAGCLAGMRRSLGAAA